MQLRFEPFYKVNRISIKENINHIHQYKYIYIYLIMFLTLHESIINFTYWTVHHKCITIFSAVTLLIYPYCTYTRHQLCRYLVTQNTNVSLPCNTGHQPCRYFVTQDTNCVVTAFNKTPSVSLHNISPLQHLNTSYMYINLP